MIYVEVDTCNRLFLRKNLSELETQILKLEEMLKKYNYKFSTIKGFRVYEIKNDISIEKVRAELKAGLSEKFFKIMKIEKTKGGKGNE